MRRAIKALREALIVALFLAAIVALVYAVFLIRDLRQAVKHTDELTVAASAFLRDTQKRTNPMLTHLDAAAGELAHTSKQLAIASRAQQEATAKYMQVLDDTHAVLVSTKATVDEVGSSVSSIGVQANDTLSALGALGRDSQVMVASANRAIADLDAQITDPAWHATLANLQATSFHAAGTMQHVDTMAGMTEAKLAQLFKPGSFVKELILRSIGVGSQARVLFLGSK